MYFSIRIRRAVLEAAIRSQCDFSTALNEFEDWIEKVGEKMEELERETSNSQAIKDTANRRKWTRAHKARETRLICTLATCVPTILYTVVVVFDYFLCFFIGWYVKLTN